MDISDIALLIDASPMNRGAVGATWLRQPGNVALSTPAGDVFLFQKHSPAVYEFHWLRSVSGPRDLIKFTRQAFREMYDVPGVCLIYGLVWDKRPDAKFMARKIGATSLGSTPTDYGNCEMFVLPRQAVED